MILSKTSVESLNDIKSTNINPGVNIEEEFLIENIPAPLADAYKKATYLGDKERSHEKAFIQRTVQPEHEEIDKKEARRYVKWNYGKASYDEITATEAISYLGLSLSENHVWRCADKASFARRISELRFIYNGQLMEWESRKSGQSIAALYSIQIPTAVLRSNNIEIMDSQGRRVNDTKYIKQYKELVDVIRLCDKIYKTDEYEYPLSPEEIAKREDKKNLMKVRRMMNTSDSDYNPHRKGDAFGGQESTPGPTSPNSNAPSTRYVPLKSNTFTRYNIADTGSHLISKRFAPHIEDAQLSNYITSLYYREDVFKFYDDLKKYLKKLEVELTEYSEKDHEYEEIKERIEEYKEMKKTAYGKYLAACEDVSKHKAKVLLTIDEGTSRFNRRMANFYDELQRLEEEFLKTRKKIEEISSFERAFDDLEKNNDDSLRYLRMQQIREINTMHYEIRDAIESAKKNGPQDDMEDSTEDFISAINNEEESESKIIELFSYWSGIQNEAAEKHFKVITGLRGKLKELNQKLDDHLYVRTKIKKEKQDALKNDSVREKGLDASLKNIVQFV